MKNKKYSKGKVTQSAQKKGGFNEDWLSVVLALGFIILASLGVFGKNGISILF